MVEYSKNLVELDGTTLEGGGQLLRISLCLSALTATPVKIYNIRGKRSSGGGLKPQHLACVNWLADTCNAYLEGAEKGSKTLLFVPWGSKDEKTGLLKQDTSTSVKPDPVFIKKRDSEGSPIFECQMIIGTAGSTGLGLQAILPFILFRHPSNTVPVRLKLSGGTNVSGSPSFEYISQVLLPILHSIGFPRIRAKLSKRGWSQGGTSIGEFILEIPPVVSTPLSAFSLTVDEPSQSGKSPKPSRIEATFLGPARIHEHLREILASTIVSYFGNQYTLNTERCTLTLEDSRHDKRFYLILVAYFPKMKSLNNSSSATEGHYILARDWLYDRKLRSQAFAATEMAERVSHELQQEWRSGAHVDEQMRDQLVIFQALAEGSSKIWSGLDEEGEAREPSLHAQTAEWVARQMLGVRWDGEGSCEKGIGYQGDNGGVFDTSKEIEGLSLQDS